MPTPSFLHEGLLDRIDYVYKTNSLSSLRRNSTLNIRDGKTNLPKVYKQKQQ